MVKLRGEKKIKKWGSGAEKIQTSTCEILKKK